MASYMIGRLMGGGASLHGGCAVLLEKGSQPACGKYTDGDRRSPATAHHDRTEAAMAKPATSTTITRGDFVQSVAKQKHMRRSATDTSSRSMGG